LIRECGTTDVALRGRVPAMVATPQQGLCRRPALSTPDTTSALPSQSVGVRVRGEPRGVAAGAAARSGGCGGEAGAPATARGAAARAGVSRGGLHLPRLRGRAVAPWRESCLFAGSDNSGDRAAAIDTLIGTAKLNDVNVEAYLRCVLEKLPDHPPERIEELLPWAIAAQRPEMQLAA
jgi:hypothetical protein